MGIFVVVVVSFVFFVFNPLGVTVKTSCEGCHPEWPSIHLELILHSALGEAPGNQTIPLPAFPI